MPAEVVQSGGSEWPTVAVCSSGMGTRGQRIKRERNRRRLSQMDLHKATGVGLRTIGRIEKGEAENAPSIEALEDFLGLSDRLPEATDTAPEEAPTIEQYTLMELLAEAVRRVAQIEARSGERINGGAHGDDHLRISWKTADAPPVHRDQHRPGGTHGAQ